MISAEFCNHKNNLTEHAKRICNVFEGFIVSCDVSKLPQLTMLFSAIKKTYEKELFKRV